MDGHTQIAVWISDSAKDAMEKIKESEGVPLAVQVRFALEEWLGRRGVPQVTQADYKPR